MERIADTSVRCHVRFDHSGAGILGRTHSVLLSVLATAFLLLLCVPCHMFQYILQLMDDDEL